MTEPAGAAITFPILLDYRERRAHPDAPRSVPWTVVEPYRDRAMRTHDQTLERLAQRGGLDPLELWALVHGINPFASGARRKLPPLDVAIRWIMDGCKPPEPLA